MNKMESIIIWSVAITTLRIFQTMGIWWFMMSFFRRNFSDYKFGFIGSSILISLLLLFNNLFIHITDNYLIFLLEYPFYFLFHRLFIKTGLGLAIIESTVGYFLFRITQVEIALIFNWANIISVQDAITKVEPAILIEFILPSIVVFTTQMFIAKKNIGYYFINNRIMPTKLGWAIWIINFILLLITLGRIVHELELFRKGYYGLDEQPYLWFFISLNLFILWKINQSEWDRHYKKQSISCFCRKKSMTTNIKKVGNYP